MELIGVFYGKTDDEYFEETEIRIREGYKDWGESQVKRSLAATAKLYESFKQYEVTAAGVEDFILRYGKPKQYADRGEDYLRVSINSHLEHLHRDGYTFITRHDSKCGENVSYYGRDTKATASGQIE